MPKLICVFQKSGLTLLIGGLLLSLLAACGPGPNDPMFYSPYYQNLQSEAQD